MTSATRTVRADVLVIGTGGAGLRAALAANDAGASVVVLARRGRLDAHTVLASGGINAVLGTRDPEDSFEQHIVDTLREGYFLSDHRMVENVVREAPAAVQELADWGCPFARTDDGRLDQRFFGAHRWRRTCYAGDFTGRAVLHTLAARVAAAGIPVLDDQYVASLLVASQSCFGALAFDLHDGTHTAALADATVLCGGGATRLWRRSTSRRDENNGEAMALALRAGCRLQDVELVQFHPSGMVWPEEAAGTLVTEAVRGEGGQLRNSLGERFMTKYDPARMELSTRDRVALANYTEILEGRGSPHGGVFLDISHREKAFILERLPRMYRQFIEYQLLDITTTAMEVAPTAHYSMGGIVVDPHDHATDVAGLYAAGECTAGLHGANRLGGNSLTETVVYGRRAGAAAAAYAESIDVSVHPRATIREAVADLDALVRPGSELGRAVQRSLQDLLWECAGVARTEEGLRRGLDRLAEVRAALGDLDVRPDAEGWTDLAVALDLRAGVLVAEATLLGALARTESRGCHVRLDHPDAEEAQRVNHGVALAGDGHLEQWQAPVPAWGPELAALLVDTPPPDLAGRLLE